MLPGSGPIIIGQACEFDYSGVQACKALRKEGYKTILVNSNPATIMTDMELAQITYIEPLTHDTLEQIIHKERPDALLPTVGGQTALNLAIALHESGVLERYNVQLIGADIEAIRRAESRRQFKATMEKIGMATPASALCNHLEEGYAFRKSHGLPLIIRPSFTLGGTGGSIVYTDDQLEEQLKAGFYSSPSGEVLLEESILGWKEFELEVMRDRADNVVIICSIENIDPMGIHTGDSITVAPQQTLSDRQYQQMRDSAIAIIRAIGVDTGGSNIQFAVNPQDGHMVVIEMNPRVSRSSALASKATGFPIARIAALLAVGYTLDEIKNEITQVTPCSFEPTIDYVVVKAPRFSFEKFPGSHRGLGTAMRSVGETMGIGRTFKEALQKALRSLENGRAGLGSDGYLNDFSTLLPYIASAKNRPLEDRRLKDFRLEGQALKSIKEKFCNRLAANLKDLYPERIFAAKAALALGLQEEEEKGGKEEKRGEEEEKRGISPVRYDFSVEGVSELTGIDPCFLYQISDLVKIERAVEAAMKEATEDRTASALSIFLKNIDADNLRYLKENGYSDRQLSFMAQKKEIFQLLHQDMISETETVAYPRDNPTERLKRLMERLESILGATLNCPPAILPSPGILDKIQKLLAQGEREIAALRRRYNLVPVYKTVDTCAGEFESYTPYLYSTYEREDESQREDRPQVVIVGAGPNRIGQGIEFDYCCCHAAQALEELGVGSIMVNCNPETVSTDYDTSNKLYFEPLTVEDLLHICRREKPQGVILSFGGQTPLMLAKGLAGEDIPILGASSDMIDQVEDRKRSSQLLKELGLRQPPGGMAFHLADAVAIKERLGFPLLVRPSYVIGGRAMDIAYNEEQLAKLVQAAIAASPEHPVLIDKFIDDAVELDVDALADGKDVFVAGIMQHIEAAGIHSGDSACVLPPLPDIVSPLLIKQIEKATRRIALQLQVVGFINIQFAIQDNDLYVLEINPRASRTVPFVSKARGLPLAKWATFLMWGKKLEELPLPQESFIKKSPTKEPPAKKPSAKKPPAIVSVKEAVLPFSRFPGADIILGPEMKSTGEVMGIATNFGQAYIKALMGTGDLIPSAGGVFFSVSDRAKPQLVDEAKSLKQLGYRLYATQGSALFLRKYGIEVEELAKIRQDQKQNPLNEIAKGSIQIIINIPYSERTRDDALTIRQEGVRRRILCITTVAGTKALVEGLRELRRQKLQVASLQSIHGIVQPSDNSKQQSNS